MASGPAKRVAEARNGRKKPSPAVWNAATSIWNMMKSTPASTPATAPWPIHQTSSRQTWGRSTSIKAATSALVQPTGPLCGNTIRL